MNNNLLDMKLQDLTAELYPLDTFSGVIENEIRNASESEIKVDFANTLLSCLSMQSAKIKEIIAAFEAFSDAVKENSNPDIPIDLLLKVYRGELPESALEQYKRTQTTD